MGGPDRLERRLRDAGRWWPDGGADEPVMLSPDRRRGLLVELRRRRLRRATGVTAVAGLAVVAALVVAIVPGSSPHRQLQADRAPSHALTLLPTAGGDCVAVRVGDRQSVCAGTLTATPSTITPSNALNSTPSNSFSSKAATSTGASAGAGTGSGASSGTGTGTGSGASTGTSPSVRVDVGTDLSVALPAGPGIRWTAVAAADAAPTPSTPSAGADLGQGLNSHQATGATGSTLTLVGRTGAQGGASTTTFRAVHAGTVVLAASAVVQCPTAGGTTAGTSACRPGTQLWRVVVTVGNS
jgi:hypothetical protein